MKRLQKVHVAILSRLKNEQPFASRTTEYLKYPTEVQLQRFWEDCNSRDKEYQHFETVIKVNSVYRVFNVEEAEQHNTLKEVYGVPRRNRVDKFVPAEKAIWTAVQEVAVMPGDALLTDAVQLLTQAQSKVAEYIDGIDAEYKEMENNRNYGNNRNSI